MTTSQVLLLLFLLFTKHFVVDFPLQTPFQWKNKGTYGHPGGILHALLHGVCTYAAAVLILGHDTAIAVAYLDSFIHYHVDWAKMKLNDSLGLKCNEHAAFWTLLGLDQFLHAVTYIGLIYLCL